MGVSTLAHPCLQALALPHFKDKQRSQPTPSDYIFNLMLHIIIFIYSIGWNIIYPRRRLPLHYLLWSDSNLRDLKAQNDNVRKRLSPSASPTNGFVGLRIPSMSLTHPVPEGTGLVGHKITNYFWIAKEFMKKIAYMTVELLCLSDIYLPHVWPFRLLFVSLPTQ